jgi:hypothetical protein
MYAEVQDRIIVFEHPLGAVTMVNIPIHNEDSLCTKPTKLIAVSVPACYQTQGKLRCMKLRRALALCATPQIQQPHMSAECALQVMLAQNY